VNLTPELEVWRREIEAYARGYGLDFYDVVFEMLDYDQLNEVASYGGFPTRYPHWRFGMDYEELSKSYSYGLSKIYELVINNNPVYAYLMKANAAVEQKLVMAHVFGHADFFKNNLWFSKTNRRMIDAMANHATRVRGHIDRYGVEAVEDFIDACLSLENLIDAHGDFIDRQERRDRSAPERDEDVDARGKVSRLPSKHYMESFINPPEFLEAQKTKLAERAQRRRQIPEEPQRDVVQFVIEHAPLENWERDILTIVRDEARYFAPQAMTKIMNEGWACLTGDALAFTARGLVPMREVSATGGPTTISDGQAPRAIYDRHVLRDQPTVRLRTRRGLELCGSVTHRVLLDDGQTWRRLDELVPGDRVMLAGGAGLWPQAEQAITWTLAEQVNLEGVAAAAGVSAWTAGRRSIRQRRPICVPPTVDERLARFLGYLVGDGQVSRAKRVVGLTTGDAPQAQAFAALAQELFGLPARLRLDGRRFRVNVYSETLSDMLENGLGLTTGSSARFQRVPEVILRSPAPVVRAFLQAYFDCDGHAGRQGVILVSASETLSRQVQLLLLNFGVLSRRTFRAGCWRVHVAGRSAQSFAERVGFFLERKQDALRAYLESYNWSLDETWDDEVVSLSHERADVYDISVEETHRYAACGFVNHNSYWHSTILTQKALRDSEVVDFADHHSGALAMRPGGFNPYKIGIELFREIEDRWNRGKFGREWEDCDDALARRRWDRKLGLGRQKIFEVRKIYNDVTFIDAFMDEEFCERLKLYVYGHDPRTGRSVLVNRDWRLVKQRLLFSLTNAGQPIIRVVDANHANRGELYLKHQFEGVPLDVEKARDTLKNLFRVWRRPVHLESVEDDRGRLLSYDGTESKSIRL
jgi:stage V sporulation protein R